MRIILTIFSILFVLTTNTLSSQTYSDIAYDAGTSVDIGSGADVCGTTININGSFSGGGTMCNGPLPVTLLSFNALIKQNNVSLYWITSIEINNSGFDIERKLNKENDSWQKISFIRGNGTTNEPVSYMFEDKKLNTGTYKYRLKQTDFNGNFEYFPLSSDVMVESPGKFSVSQNYPNPSNPKSKIDFQIPFDGKVSIKIYDISGREVAILVDGFRSADFYTVEFDGSNLASGVYFYRSIVVGNDQKFTDIKKIVLVK